jgi:hypothetical protein
VRKCVKQFKRIKRVKRDGEIKIALARLLGRRGQHPTMPQGASGRGLPSGEVRSRLAFKAHLTPPSLLLARDAGQGKGATGGGARQPKWELDSKD